MIISIASGKGGTGKTTVSTSLVLSLEGKVQLIDCDVEEPNAHIFIKPTKIEREPVYVMVPEIDEEKCDHCGKCQDVCVYNAIAVIPAKENVEGKTLVFKELCHGCGACMYFCPHGAIKEIHREIGCIESGIAGEIGFVNGTLNIGEALAPPLIRAVKRRIDSEGTVIIDAPPGTTCPVITSISDSDYCVLVTEPTPFGLNDLVLAVELLREMSMPFGVVVNRSDMGDTKTAEYCIKENISVLMEIPFRKEIAMAYSTGIPIVEAFPEYKQSFKSMFKKIEESVCR